MAVITGFYANLTIEEIFGLHALMDYAYDFTLIA